MHSTDQLEYTAPEEFIVLEHRVRVNLVLYDSVGYSSNVLELMCSIPKLLQTLSKP